MKFVAEATARKETGKGVARQIRRAGRIPAVMYGQGESHLLELDPAAVRKILIAQAGSTGLISLRIRSILLPVLCCMLIFSKLQWIKWFAFKFKSM